MLSRNKHTGVFCVGLQKIFDFQKSSTIFWILLKSEKVLKYRQKQVLFRGGLYKILSVYSQA